MLIVSVADLQGKGSGILDLPESLALMKSARDSSTGRRWNQLHMCGEHHINYHIINTLITRFSVDGASLT